MTCQTAIFLPQPPTSAQLAPSQSTELELTQFNSTIRNHHRTRSDTSDTNTNADSSLPQRPTEEPSDDEVTQIDREMSRTPLLLRSAPAHGTGSYGVLPIHVDTSDDEDGEIGSTRRNWRNAKGKGKSSLRRTVSAHDDGPSTACDAQEDIEPARKRKNSVQVKRRKWGSEDAFGSVVDGAQGLGSEPRFTTSALPSFDTGRTSVFEGLHSSSESDDDDLLRESNANGSSHNKSHTIEFPNGEVTDNSPYAQVRASVPPTDNVTLSINTPRMWTLSIFFAIFGSATNLFFSLRYPSVSITPVIALLIVHPMGLLWDRILKRSDDPDEVFENGSLRKHKRDGSQVVIGGDDDSDGDEYESTTQPERAPSNSGSSRPTEKWTRRLRLWLAQGRWNEKEHCCVFISSNVSFGFAFATDVGSLESSTYPSTNKLLRSSLSKPSSITKKSLSFTRSFLRCRLKYLATPLPEPLAAF